MNDCICTFTRKDTISSKPDIEFSNTAELWYNQFNLILIYTWDKIVWCFHTFYRNNLCKLIPCLSMSMSIIVSSLMTVVSVKKTKCLLQFFKTFLKKYLNYDKQVFDNWHDNIIVLNRYKIIDLLKYCRSYIIYSFVNVFYFFSPFSSLLYYYPYYINCNRKYIIVAMVISSY